MNKVDLKTKKKQKFKNVELGYLRNSYSMLSHFATYKAKGDTSSYQKVIKIQLTKHSTWKRGPIINSLPRPISMAESAL